MQYRPTPLRALRRPNATLARHRIGQPAHEADPAFPVPGSVACVTGCCPPSPDSRGLPREGEDARLAVIFNEAHCYRPVIRLTCYCLKLPSA
jgi:hypothetical protein